MGKGYAEGPAAEEAERRLEELAAGAARAPRSTERAAVYGSTADEPERHFLGWLDDVDPDELFASGAAYGITVVRRAGGRRAPASRLQPVTWPSSTSTRYRYVLSNA